MQRAYLNTGQITDDDPHVLSTPPAQWPDPLRFDIGRRAAGHLAFGAGIHGCVGQSVARAEGEAMFRALVERVERIEFDGDAIWRPNNAIRALDRLPLRLVAA